MNYSRLIFTIFSAIASILAFAIWSNNNNIYVYAQQLYSPSASPTPLSQLPQQTNNNTGSGSSNSSVPIVLRPLPGGTCPSGYHLVSGAVCIKDIAQSAPPRTTSAIPTTNATKSFSIPSPAPSQPNGTNPTNNEENFNTKILKSFNEELK
ncbi:MAG: hypothetical protein ACJ71M_02150 [Nitrososphaeraceae archaeon]